MRAYLPQFNITDRQLADDLTLRGIAVEGVFDLGANGSLFEMDITTNRVDAMNHYGIAREAATIYGLSLHSLDNVIKDLSSRPKRSRRRRDLQFQSASRNQPSVDASPPAFSATLKSHNQRAS